MKKSLVRLCVIGLMLIAIIDVLPTTATLLPLKTGTAKVADLVGVRQGPWSMFAPNPVINNGWLTAEMKTAEGQAIQWESPYWSRSSTWDKFVRFRHVNYYNRLHAPWCARAAEDFISYLMRTADQPIQSLQLFDNRMHLIMPEDGSLPPHDEAVWTLAPEPWIRRCSEQ